MKRADITNLFPEATDEQVKALMDINGADINNAKGNYQEIQAQLAETQEQLKAATEDAGKLNEAIERANTLQTELDDIKNANAIREMKDKVSASTGVPISLLTGTTEDECTEQANAIKAYATPKYPKVSDGGEPMNTGGKVATRDQFAEFFEQTMN